MSTSSLSSVLRAGAGAAASRGRLPETSALDAAAARWEKVAYATGPADRGTAEAGVRLAYRSAGLAEPERIVWLDSPVWGAFAAAVLTGSGHDRRVLRRGGLGGVVDDVIGRVGVDDPGPLVREAVRTRPWERARASAHSLLGPSGWARAWALTGGRLWGPANRLVTDVRRAVGELAGPEGEDTAALLRGAMLDAVLGQHDAPWLSLFDVLDRPELHGLAKVARSAGWWWPFERVALVCERPAELHLDDSGRLHKATGPAMTYPDGFALHAWRGMPVPADFAAGLATLTPARIRAEENAELRRVMLEHYGFDRYLADSGARPVHSDRSGVLWRIDLPDDEPIVMVEVVNSTPEPDGTSRTYWLRVPPRTASAQEGVAWTFGLTSEDYRPKIET